MNLLEFKERLEKEIETANKRKIDLKEIKVKMMLSRLGGDSISPDLAGLWTNTDGNEVTLVLTCPITNLKIRLYETFGEEGADEMIKMLNSISESQSDEPTKN